MVEQPDGSEEQKSGIGPSPDASGNAGIVYVLSNPAMVGYVKIGETGGNSSSDVQRRMKELDATGVPRPFNCEYAAVVRDYKVVEKALHEAFGDYRVRDNREFFEELEAFRVRAVIKLLEVKDVTPKGDEDDEDGGKVRPPKATPFTFKMVDIVVGATLQWADDDQIECEVFDEKTSVVYKGQRWAISPLARELKGWKNVPSGTGYWLYEGETLQKRRERLEREKASADDE